MASTSGGKAQAGLATGRILPSERITKAAEAFPSMAAFATSPPNLCKTNGDMRMPGGCPIRTLVGLAQVFNF